jgi:membrane protein
VAFVGPFTLLRRVIRRLDSIGWTRAAGSLAFTSLLGLVPLATVTFAFVAQFPVFQDFLRVLENYLLRYTLPETASELVRKYVVGLASEAASLKGLWIFFVVVTAALVVDSVESEINAIWRIDRKRPILRRVLVYTIGVTAGPVMLGGAIWIIRWIITLSITAVALDKSHISALAHIATFFLAVAIFTLMYVIAPARKVKWRHGLIGGLLAAAAFELTRAGFTWYVAHSPTYEILYGALAAVPVFMLWVFLFWMIVLAGAAVTASIADTGD